MVKPSQSFFEIINGTMTSCPEIVVIVVVVSVLGHLLFILYIIPISHIINKYPTIKYHLYADDIILFHEVPLLLSQHIDVIYTCVNELNHWLIMNKLYLNKNKSELLNVPAHIPIYFFSSS